MADESNIKPQNRDFIRVGRSRIVGKGVFAKRKIPKGTRIIEYQGDRVPLKSFLAEVMEGKPASVYVFHLTDSVVIDGARNGNEARFINHSCEPNCTVYKFSEQLYIYAMRDIVRGEELSFDYQLGTANKTRNENQNVEAYACKCGSPNCRGTMLAMKKNSQKST